jgi:hypothetical protein
MACTLTLSHFIWEMGHQAMWSRSSRGEAVALGACGSGPLMMVGGAKGSWIPSSPIRTRAWSGWRTWWEVEWGLDSFSMPSLTLPLLHGRHHTAT